MELAGISVDEMKLDTPELIRKYAGIPGSSEKHTGYNTPGTDPEFIWQNLPDKLESVHWCTWSSFQSICKFGLGGIKGRSAEIHEISGGFWFTTCPGWSPFLEAPWEDLSSRPGTLLVGFNFNKNVLDPKKTYWDGEAGGDEIGLEKWGAWETDDLREFWYNGTLSVDKCKIMVYAPRESKGIISPDISQVEFETLIHSKA